MSSLWTGLRRSQPTTRVELFREFDRIYDVKTNVRVISSDLRQQRGLAPLWIRILVAGAATALLAGLAQWRTAASALGQTPSSTQTPSDSATRPKFEVASVKQTKFTPGLMGIQYLPGGRMLVQQSPAQLLIGVAYGMPVTRLDTSKIPVLTLQTLYNIEAKAPASAFEGASDRVPRQRLAQMLQVLLEDRFRLTFHREPRKVPVFELLVGTRGTHFKKAPDRDCTEKQWTPTPCHAFPGGPARGAVGKTVNMDDLARYLTTFIGQEVVNRTGLRGDFDIDLPPWSRGTEVAGRPADDGREPVSDPSSPSIFGVMEDLGLKLQSSKATLDVTVIDHLETPADN